jgi:hypothetical protein
VTKVTLRLVTLAYWQALANCCDRTAGWL